MSWFETTGFASIAKTALKEAQRTIDKALDIKEERQLTGHLHTNKQEKLKKETQNFFSSFGISDGGPSALKSPLGDGNIIQDEKEPSAGGVAGGLWGSFTGSFFENPLNPSDNSKTSSDAETPLDTIIETQPPRFLGDFTNATSDSVTTSTSSSSIIQLSAGALSPYQDDVLDSPQPQAFQHPDTTIPSPQLDALINKSGWGWDSWGNGSIMVMSSNLQSPESYPVPSANEEIHDDCLADDSIDLDGFASSRLVVRSVESDCTLRQESLSSIHSTKSATEIDIMQNVVEEVFVDPFEEKRDTPSPLLSHLIIEKETLLNIPSISSPDSIITLPSCDTSPREDLSEGVSSSAVAIPSSNIYSSESDPLRASDNMDPSFEILRISTLNDASLTALEAQTQDNPLSSSPQSRNLDKELSFLAITKQPISSVLPQSFDFPSPEEENHPISSDNSHTSQQESFQEESSTCDSIHSASTSSTLTALESSVAGQEILNTSFADSPIKLSAPMNTADIRRKLDKDTLEMNPMKLDSDHSECKNKDAVSSSLSFSKSKECPDSVALECSARSESSSETVTTSVDSQNFLWTDGELIENDGVSNSGGEVQELLQEAMSDEKGPLRVLSPSPCEDELSIEKVSPKSRGELSPASSEKSDILKTGSEYTSGHSSTDEIETETATSSDIEVISSPSMDSNNGNSRSVSSASGVAPRLWGSTQQRGFRSVLNERSSDFGTSAGRRESDCVESHDRGHRRNKSNISETSEESSAADPPLTEVDRLLKKLAQLSEILQAREAKVLELSHSNASLQETNHSLKIHVDELEASKRGSDSPESVREEFTQRLVTMERKFQQALRDKELSKKQLEELKVETSSRSSSSEVFRELEEKDTIIKELRDEGEKLSKQERQHLNIIKKLRLKERDCDSLIKTQKDRIEEQDLELERLQKQLLAKEEVERSQIDAIRRLTLVNEKLEVDLKDANALAAELEGKSGTLKGALEATYREIAELQRLAAARQAEAHQLALSAEFSARQKADVVVADIQGQHSRDQDALLAQIHELNDAHHRTEEQNNRKERQLKLDIRDLQQRLADSETRCDELSDAVSAATRPLLRQLGSLQSSHKAQQITWENLEDSLNKRLYESQHTLILSQEKERSSKQQHAAVLSELSNLQAQLNSFKIDAADLQSKLQNASTKAVSLEEAKRRESNQLEALKSSFAEEIGEIKHERDSLEQQLDIERTALSAEKKKSHQLQDQMKEKDRKMAAAQFQLHNHEDGNRSITPRSSPTPSLSRVSVSESLVGGGSHWGDDVFDIGFSSGRGTLYDSLRGNSAATVDILTSTLRQREGELHHLQTEVTRFEIQRETLAQELVEASEQVDLLETQVKESDLLQTRFKELEQKYNALLQMHGEKVEEVEELSLDLLDVKEMYKTQIDELMKK